MFNDFLSDPQEYQACKQFWQALVNEVADAMGQSGQWLPWMSELPDEDGNPMYNAWSRPTGRAVRIIQYSKEETDGRDLGGYVESEKNNLGFDVPDHELVLMLTLNEATAEGARDLIRKWMDPTTSPMEMQVIVEHFDPASMGRPLPVIGIVGAGTMGSGIALAALYAGCEVFLCDAYPEILHKASDYIQKFLEKKELGERFTRLHLVSKLEELAPAQIVIEAAPEKLELKQDIFRQLDNICPPPAILASNTSTLTVTTIATATQHPERVAGMHFFNPASVLKLVEVVRAAQSSEATVNTLVDLALVLGKTPVVTGDTPGFIVNRLARPFYGEALRLLGEQVAWVEIIDRIVERGGGFKMGPFKLMDLIGIDINAGAMQSMYEQTFGEPRYQPHWLQMQKVAEGALGRKTGRGFYEYENGDFKDKTIGFQQELAIGGGEGQIVISEGSWAPGLADLCRQAGYEVITGPQKGVKPVAAFVAAGRDEGAEGILREFDQVLEHEVPILAQCADVTMDELRNSVSVANIDRLMGFDGLFLANGPIVTLIHSTIAKEQWFEVESMFHKLGRELAWVADSPGLVLPRIVCQLANEAAFAAQEAIADISTFDIAMKLGVSYPRGPLEWGDELGWDKVLGVIDHLYAEYHEERYRACVLLRHWARQTG